MKRNTLKKIKLSNTVKALPRSLYMLVVGGLALYAVSLPIVAADNPLSPVVLADEPLGSVGVTPINMIFMADDSGSMLWTHTPEDIGSIPRACWYPVEPAGGMLCPSTDTSCRASDVCGYPYPNPDSRASSAKDAEIRAIQVYHPQFLAAAFNKMAYNPMHTYAPPVVIVNGKEEKFPSMKDASSNWTQVGWPSSAHGIARPQGAPVVLDFKKFTDPQKYNNDATFIRARTYLPAQFESLQKRFMNGATAAQEAEANKLSDRNRSYVAPLHYFKTRVKWCRYYQSSITQGKNIATPTQFDEGLLFLGSASAQDCREDRGNAEQPALANQPVNPNVPPSYQYPYFYNPTGNFADAKHNKKPAFEVVVLDYNATATELVKTISHSFTDETGKTNTVTRTYAEELENYANWYAYYSNKTVAMRTVTSFALAGIDLKHPIYAGVVTLHSSSSTNLSNLKELNNTTQRFEVFKALLEHGVTGNKNTPLKTGVLNIRSAFNQAGSKKLQVCSRNYTVALSDGLWNDSGSSGNQDDTARVAHNGTSVLGVNLSAYASFPEPIRENRYASSTLADAAMEAWITPLNGDGKTDTSSQDPARWAHMNFIGLSYGSILIVPTPEEDQDAATLAGLRFGELNWDKQDALLKGFVDKKIKWSVPKLNENTAFEDFWHATLTGFGSMTASSNPEDFATSIENGSNSYQLGLRYIKNRSGEGAESTIPPDSSCGDSYFAGYLEGWGGNVTKGQLNCSDGALNNLQKPSTKWLASEVFAQKISASADTWKSRKISTANSVSKTQVDFKFENLSPAQKTSLGATEAEQKAVIDYLRGDASHETENEFNPMKPPVVNPFNFRSRYGVLTAEANSGYGHRPLADFVHAEPVLTDPPISSFEDSTDQGYSAFKTLHETRPRMVFAASNGGMLHALDDSGEEQWAFIPPELFRATRGIDHLPKLPADSNDVWKHYYYVDSPPRVIDVDLNAGKNAAQYSPDWRTILIGGMGKGGTAYYALDITDADKQQGKYLWSFTDANMGYTYGRALLVKTNSCNWNLCQGGTTKSGKWVAIVPSGLNNANSNDLKSGGSGKGILYFIDIATGAKLHQIEVPQGTSAQPVGLTYVRGYVKSVKDQTVSNVYGGDQFGNVWRFDLSDTNEQHWSVERLATLTDKNGNPQPVNTEPAMEVVKDSSGNPQRWIIIGTGRFYDEKDVVDKATNKFPTLRHSLYAIKDGARDQFDTARTQPATRGDFFDATDETTLPSMTSFAGFVDDFETANAEGYQVITHPVSTHGIVAYVANRYILPGTKNLDPCKNAQFQSRVLARNLGSGKTVLNKTMEDGLVTLRFAVTSGGRLRLIAFTDAATGDARVFDVGSISTGDKGIVPHRSTIRYIDTK